MAQAQHLSPFKTLPSRCGGLTAMRPRLTPLRHLQQIQRRYIGPILAYSENNENQGKKPDTVTSEEDAIAAMSQAIILASIESTNFLEALRTWHEKTLKPQITKFQQQSVVLQIVQGARTQDGFKQNHAKTQALFDTWQAENHLGKFALKSRISVRWAYEDLKQMYNKDVVPYVKAVTGVDISRYYPPFPDPPMLAATIVGLLLCAIVLLRSISKAITNIWKRSTQQAKNNNGKFVRDRALGGKLVHVPRSPKFDNDFPKRLSQSKNAQKGPANKPGADSLLKLSVGADGNPTPLWWGPPGPAKHCPAFRKTELSQQGRETIRMLEDCKMAGQDYPLYLLLRIRRICHEGAGLQVRVPTEGGRDSLLKATIRYAMDAALKDSPMSELGGYEPGQLVSGVACDLNVPMKRAVSFVQIQVASTCRSSLIEAEVAFRTKDQNRFDDALSRMILTLRAFPMPLGSPEAELVGRSIQGQTTLEFRRDVFLAVGFAALDVAPTVAELMGFEPAQVMEQLRMQVAAKSEATAAREKALREKLVQQTVAARAQAEKEQREEKARKDAATAMAMKKAEEERKAKESLAAKAKEAAAVEKEKKLQQVLQMAAAAMKAIAELKMQREKQAEESRQAAAAAKENEKKEAEKAAAATAQRKEEMEAQKAAAKAAADPDLDEAEKDRLAREALRVHEEKLKASLSQEAKAAVAKVMAKKRTELEVAKAVAAAKREKEAAEKKKEEQRKLQAKKKEEQKKMEEKKKEEQKRIEEKSDEKTEEKKKGKQNKGK